ncbi:hypothetical protein EDD17DRAFT_1534764 [Pisolithus thermaeus]|nr:hypothetical protein EDD17DRAFT_1534764 [Pisolithus thermaeus]
MYLFWPTEGNLPAVHRLLLVNIVALLYAMHWPVVQNQIASTCLYCDLVGHVNCIACPLLVSSCTSDRLTTMSIRKILCAKSVYDVLNIFQHRLGLWGCFIAFRRVQQMFSSV